MNPDLDALRDVARAVSAELVAGDLACGRRVRTPRDPGSTYVKLAFRHLLVAADLGLITVTPPADAGRTATTQGPA